MLAVWASRMFISVVCVCVYPFQIVWCKFAASAYVMKFVLTIYHICTIINHARIHSCTNTLTHTQARMVLIEWENKLIFFFF